MCKFLFCRTLLHMNIFLSHLSHSSVPPSFPLPLFFSHTEPNEVVFEELDLLRCPAVHQQPTVHPHPVWLLQLQRGHIIHIMANSDLPSFTPYSTYNYLHVIDSLGTRPSEKCLVPRLLAQSGSGSAYYVTCHVYFNNDVTRN